MSVRAEARSPVREFADWIAALIQLTKPRVTRLVLFTTAFGALLAPGNMDLGRLFVTLLGSALVVASTNALNMYLEHDVDELMERTRQRPLPSGRVSPEAALSFGIALGGAGLFTLGLGVNALTGEIALLALLSYVLIYTPLKAVSTLSLYVGAVPGAIPPLLGYAGLAGELTPQAWSLFWLLFVWQVPHFLAIAIFRRSEYAAAGLRVMPVVYGVERTRHAIVAGAVVLLAVSLVPWFLGLGGVAYATLALTSGLAFLGFAIWGERGRGVERWARTLFFASMPHLVLLFGALALTAP